MAKSGTSEVAQVDDANDLLKTQEMVNKYKENSSIDVISKRVKVSTPISILIESLVKNLCSIYERDVEKVTILYNLICEKLFQMNLIDESYNMDEFEGMRSEYQKAFHHLLKNALGADQHRALRPVWPCLDTANSHYYKEFDEIEYIAGGGFGQVFRVKHKLDGTEYAVKKIPIRSQGIESVRNYLSEVKTFASMNHSNIVQYKAAWLELGALTNNVLTTEADTDSLSNQSSKLNHLDEDYIYHDNSHSFSDQKSQSSDFEVNFQHSFTSINHSQPLKQLKRKREKRDSISEGGNAICKLDLNEIKQQQQKTQVKWATLYIQMALCQSTLKQWLEKRNNTEFDVKFPISMRNNKIYEILRQLLKGLEYIHSKGIVHHDIKPSNIFIQLDNGNLLVQLGDFGLACPLQSVRHSLAFGTKLYAAPEQLAGKCNPKSDMYSLGIVLFELVEQFRTDMERVQYISELRKGHLPAHLLIQKREFSQIISELVKKYPEDRPDASKLLKQLTTATAITNSDVYKKIEELQCQLAERDEEISRLKQMLQSVCSGSGSGSV